MTLVLLLLVTALWGVQAAEGIVGSWSGKLKLQPGFELTVNIHIEQKGTEYTAKMDSPDQGAYGIPVSSITFAENKLVLKVATLGVRYEGALKDNQISGTFTQAGHSFPLQLTRMKAEEKEESPSQPLPYHEEKITFENPQSHLQIGATLSYPKLEGAFPAVLLIAGSGPMDRDSKVFNLKPLADIADYLTRAGYVVLRYDKRGIGESGGEFSKVVYSDLISDATAALDYLKSLPVVEGSSVGVIGHSEGGLVAQVLASRGMVDYLVMLATPATSGKETIIFQNKVLLEPMLQEGKEEDFDESIRSLFDTVMMESATREADSLALLQFNNQLLTQLLKPQYREQVARSVTSPKAIKHNLDSYTHPYYLEFLHFDPAQNLPTIQVPILSVIGEKDQQVDADVNLLLLQDLVPSAKCVLRPELNHLFMESKTGSPVEYPMLRGHFDEGTLQIIVDWIQSLER